MKRTLFALVVLSSVPAWAQQNPRSQGEVIVIHEKPPGEPAAWLNPRRIPPPYTDDAILADSHVRAWAVLDVDATGKVTRVEFLRRPGLGLDKVAIAEAATYRFAPATDGSGKAIPARIIWFFDWPPYFRDREIQVTAVRDRCDRGPGPVNLDGYPVQFDCRRPTLDELRSVLGPSARYPEDNAHTRMRPYAR